MSLPRDEEASAGGDSERKRLYPGFYRAIQRGENDEDGAEFRRLFYVAATRAGDHLYLSGEHSEKDDRDAWLSWAMPVLATIGDGRVEIRPPAPLDFEAIQRQGPKPAAIPAAETEVDYVAPLLARPPVIPVRTSTPVTSILPEADHPWSGHGDGLAAFRGTVAHRAVELTYGAKACPPLPELIAQLRDRPLAREDAERVAAEVEGYLERFAASELGRLLAAGEIEARYEVPFAWDWGGVPVHGTVDLVYRDRGGGWHVVDFKTDAVGGRSLAAAAGPYLAQLGLYGMAVERAVGARPALELYFLRSGEVYEAAWSDVAPAVAEARERVDAGTELAVEAGASEGV